MDENTLTIPPVIAQPVFEARAEIQVAADRAAVYAVVSDLGRSGEWSPECRGGEWVVGAPATVGAVFRGVNVRAADVVAWAPVVRGTWSTDSEVVSAEPGHTFRWAMHDKAGQKQDSVWGFDIEPAQDGSADGSTLVHHFRMGAPTEGIRTFTAEMSEAEREKFFAEWGEKLAQDLRSTLGRIKHVIEQTQQTN